MQRRNAIQESPLAGARPHMRDRLGHLAHIVVGHRQQHRVRALCHEVADQRALEQLEGERARDHAHREAPVRVRRAAQVIGQDRRLGAGGVGVVQPVEKGGEGLHGGNVVHIGPCKNPVARGQATEAATVSVARMGHDLCEICAGVRRVPAVRARSRWRGAVRASWRAVNANVGEDRLRLHRRQIAARLRSVASRRSCYAAARLRPLARRSLPLLYLLHAGDPVSEVLLPARRTGRD